LVHAGNVKDAEDLTSQTFMAALEGIRSFLGRGSFAAWIMGIAARKRALFFRRQANEIPLEENLVLPAQGQQVDKAISQKIQEEELLRALRQISPERAEALVLCIFSWLSAKEAGRVLRKNEAAVRMLVSRGLNDLRTRTTLAWEADDE
jgi:RNA polymerase sigma-70 factor (ECF subfamily)